MGFYTAWTNYFFNVRPIVRRFAREHPDATVLVSGAVKMFRSAEAVPLGRDAAWSYSMRGVLLATSTGLVGLPVPRFSKLHAAEINGLPPGQPWSLDYASVVHAAVIDVLDQRQHGMVLHLATASAHYYLGVMADEAWLTLPLNWTREQATLPPRPPEQVWLRRKAILELAGIIIFLGLFLLAVLLG